jgi:hypothetical protein
MSLKNCRKWIFGKVKDTIKNVIKYYIIGA